MEFLLILGGMDGLIHVTDLSWERLTTRQKFKVGEEIEVIVTIR